MHSVHLVRNLVNFINVHDFTVDLDNLRYIPVEFTVSPEVKVTTKDWISIFPRNYDFHSSVKDFLKEIIAYEFVLHRPVSKKELRYYMKISLKGAKGLWIGNEYRFVYFNRYSEVLGVSEPFKFLEPNSNAKETSSKIHTNIASRTEAEDEHVNIIYKLENLELGKSGVEAEFGEQSLQERNVSFINKRDEQKKKTRGNCPGRNDNKNRGNNNQEFQRSYEFHAEAAHGSGSNSPGQLVRQYRPPTSPSCFNCKRVGSLLNIQSELYQKVKNQAELNNDLKERVACLSKQVELGQAAYQKQTVLLMRERELRVFYERAAQDRITTYQNYQVVYFYQPIFMGFDKSRRPVVGFQPTMQFIPPISQQVPYQLLDFESDPAVILQPLVSERTGTEGNLRYNQMLKFKAIIGNQDEKLRFFTQQLVREQETVRSLKQQLAELQSEKAQKVVAIVKDVGELCSEIQTFNNNVGEADELK